MIDTLPEEDKHLYDTVTFYCSKCGSMLFQSQASIYTCPCGLKWQTPDPICLSDITIKVKKEINGKVV